MRAAFVRTHNWVELRDVVDATPAANQVLLRIDGCGVCGSDFMEAAAWARSWKRFGHEIAATVLDIGSGVTNVTPGDQVALALSAPCGQCPGCLAGNPRHCTGLVAAEQGGYAERLIVPDERLLVRAPEPIDPELMIFAEPLSVILDAFHTMNLRPGDRLVTIGGGFLSCLGILAGKALGAAPAICLSRGLHSGLEACLKAVGGEYFQWQSLARITLSPPKAFAQRLAGLPERLVVLHTPPGKYLANYFGSLPFDSTIVNIGLSSRGRDNRVKIDCSKLIFNRINLLSAFPVPCLYMEEALQLLCDHRELFTILWPEKTPLEHLPEIIAAHRRSGRKIMIAPGQVGRKG